jgi:CheY-like chemotaxis protein/HPt (histidine-containing phosphotransfer) domain-containing protein
VLLPLADGVEPPHVEHARRAPHTHRLRILCAEDFPTNQIIARLMIEEMGHQVDVVANGAEAVQACSRTRYDLVLMDGRMPEMDGATATRLIRAGGTMEFPTLDQHVMIVALTANATSEDRARYLACGMDAFLTKPIDEEALHVEIARAIERQQQRGVPLTPMPASALVQDTAAAVPVRESVAALAELDAMFGVTAEAPPAAPAQAAPPNQGRRANDLSARLRAAFAADLPRRRAELDAALDAGDFDTAGRVLHGLRGSASHLGEAAIQQLCAELEAAADARDEARLRAGLPRLAIVLAGFGTGPA